MIRDSSGWTIFGLGSGRAYRRVLNDGPVAADEWRPVAAINDRGLVLGVVFALDWPTEYWPGLALGWLESGYPLPGVRHAVADAKDDQRRSQQFRHRALRLYRQADV